MRISDWSSDVCSSDLLVLLDESQQVRKLERRETLRLEHGLDAADEPVQIGHVGQDVVGDEEIRPTLITRQTIGERRAEEDRKSVLSGKSVCVRVDIGGRRNHKNKHTTTTQST